MKKFALATVAVLALAMLRGLQLPLLWTSTHYLFTYEEGFAKRGFFGQLLALTLGDARFRYQNLTIVAFLVLAALVLLLTVVSIRQKNAYFLLFLAGPVGGYLFLEVGYLDQVLYLLALVGGLAAIKWPRCRHPVTLTAGLLGLFVHEAALFLSCPVLVFACLMARPREGRGLLRELAPFLCFPVVGALISEFGNLTVEAADRLRLAAQSQADFHLRVDAFEVFYRAMADNARIVLGLWADGQLVHRFYEVAPLTTLYAAASFFGLAGVLRVASGPRSTRLFAAALATLAPLALSVLGWDLDRWGALVMLNAFLCLLFAAQAIGQHVVRRALSLHGAVVAAAVFVGVFSRYPFMIGHPERLPPYRGAFEFPRPKG